MPIIPPKPLRLGTRGSMLAMAQSRLVADALMRAHSGLQVQLEIVKTTGDRVTDRPLADLGGKGLFTRELELALLAGSIDFAVHSYKDVPVTMPLVDVHDLLIAAVPPREDPRDVLILRDPHRPLAPDARVGTSSPRRRAQLLAAAPALNIVPARGNIDTRLRKLRDGEYDALLLALAGLHRARLFDPATMRPLDPVAEMIPAAGQGALALQCRRDDPSIRALLRHLHHDATEQCVNIERALVAALHGDCHSPIAAHATLDASARITLHAATAARDGNPPVYFATVSAPADRAHELIEQTLAQLELQHSPVRSIRLSHT